MFSGICEFGSLEDVGKSGNCEVLETRKFRKWKIGIYEFLNLEVVSIMSLRMLGVQVSWDL